MAIDRDNNRTPRSSDGNDRRKANDRPITEKEYQDLYSRIAALRETVTGRLSGELTQNPQVADAINSQIDEMLAAVVRADSLKPPPPDKGLAQLVGLGPEAASELGRLERHWGLNPTTRPLPPRESTRLAICITSTNMNA